MGRLNLTPFNTTIVNWVSLDTNCKPLSLIINVGTPPAAKTLFDSWTPDDKEQSGTESSYIHLMEAQVNKTIQHSNVCYLP